MLNNFISLFENISIKRFKENFPSLKKEIIVKNELKIQLEEKDISIFIKIIRKYGLKIMNNINYILKRKNLKYKNIKSDIDKGKMKQLFSKQFLILFIYLYYYINNDPSIKFDDKKNKNIEKKFEEIYNNLYILLLKHYSTRFDDAYNIIDINKVSDIFGFNILASLTDLSYNNFIFNTSILYLIKFIMENNYLEGFNFIIELFKQIYNNLLNNINNLIFLQRNKKIANFAILKLVKLIAFDENFKNDIFKILDLIYRNNYSNIISSLILNEVKECFYELKKDFNKNKIINCIKYLNNQTEFLNFVFTNEGSEKKDIYRPHSYFAFEGNTECGIIFNPNYELIKKNFTLVFSFKINEIKSNLIYPLITFMSEISTKKDILFALYINDNQIYLFCESKLIPIDKISTHTSYIVVVEFFKSMSLSILNDKIKISVNGNKKEINSCNINYKSKSSLKIGHIPKEYLINQNIFTNVCNFNGIIGPILFFNNILDEKDFVKNILKLKGRYDCILLINKDNNLNNYFDYDEYKSNDNDFIEAQEYFSKLSKKIDEECLFTITPLSVINSNVHKTNVFMEGIYKKNNKELLNNMEIFPNFSIFPIYSMKMNSIYAKINMKSISSFVQYDGISIYILIIEYFYNLLRMLINEPKEEKKIIVNEIYNALSSIFYSITEIILFMKINLFENDLDTFGFSLKKLLGLLIDTQPLNHRLIDTFRKTIPKLIEHQKNSEKTNGQIILNFINKLFKLICSAEYYDLSDYVNTGAVIRLLNSIIKNNEQLINAEIFDSLLSWSVVLNTISLDKFINKPSGYTFKKNIEYKQMKKEYQNLIITFVKQCFSLDTNIKFIQSVVKRNISFLEKYRLMKIYYENHNISLICDTFDKEKGSTKSLFYIFKKDKADDNKNNYNLEDLHNELKKNLGKLIDLSPLVDFKAERHFELLKAIFILLIYEINVTIPNNKDNSQLNNKNDLNSSNSNNSKDKISFFSSSALEQVKENKIKNYIDLSVNSSLNISPSSIKMEKSVDADIVEDGPGIYELNFSSDDNNDSDEKRETIKRNTIVDLKGIYILDILLKSKSYSFYIIKTIFSCLCDQWNKDNKLKFIKSEDETYENFDLYFGELNLFKKELLAQCMKLIECMNEENIIEKSLKLMFSFMDQSIKMFKNKNKNKYSKSILLHLFESKTILNPFFEFCINNEIITDKSFMDYIMSSFKTINNTILLYHPRPFIFSFIKNCINNKNAQIIIIIKNICDSIIQNMKMNNKPDLKINNYLYFNIIHFIKSLLSVFDKNSTNAQQLLINDNFKLFLSIQNLVFELSKKEIIYDAKIYVFNPNCFNESNKNKEKKDSKILQSQETKCISNQIMFINLFALSIYSSFLIRTQSQDVKGEKYALEYISKLCEKMTYNNHFISYYLDLANQRFHFANKKSKEIPENIIKLINSEINDKYKHFLNGNPPVRDSRMITVLLYLIILKYRILLIDYERMQNFEKGKDVINAKIEIIRKTFNMLTSIAQNELLSLFSSINRIKDDKKIQIIIDKEESKSKEFKEYHRNYYKHFVDLIMKSKNKNICLENIINEMESKFIKEENIKGKNRISFLRTSTSITNNDNSSTRNTIYKREKIKRTSYFYYYDDVKEETDNNSTTTLKRMNSKSNSVKERKSLNIENIIKNKFDIIDIKKLDFENAKYPILCTKRDLVLKKFGCYYYDDYFKDQTFIKMKKLFLYLNNPKYEYNSFYDFQNIMNNKYPYIFKNFSNHSTYYPRMFFRPYTKLFEDKYFKKSHAYFEDKINDCQNEEKIFHLEYGHGLLNQPNFNLYTLSNINDEFSNVTDLSTMNECRISNAIDDAEYNEIERLYRSKAGNSFYVRDRTPHIVSKDDSFSQKNNIRQKAKRRTNPKKLTLEKNDKNQILAFGSTNKKEKLPSFECELISPKSPSHGILTLTQRFIIFQVDTKFNTKLYEKDTKYLISSSHSDLMQIEKQIIIPYTLIIQILFRKFLFINQALEIFLSNGKSYFFNLYKQENRTQFIQNLRDKIKDEDKQFEIIEDSVEYFNKNKFLNSWQEGKITALDYLLLVNKFSNRSYNDITQYLVFPWILTDFNDIYNSKNRRNMSFLMPAQSEQGIQNIIQSYEEKIDDEFKYYFPTVYSNSMYVNNYLIRLYPFINNQIRIQGGKFDEPARQFNSPQELCNYFKSSFDSVIELIPEFYLLPELFLNLNYCFYGNEKKGDKYSLVNNMNLGKSFKSILEFINFHETTLNSDIFNFEINKWIDIIFGENQITNKKNIFNSFPRESYEKNVKDEINQKLNILKSLKADNQNTQNVSRFTVGLKKQKTSLNINAKGTNIRIIMNEIQNIILKPYLNGQCPSQLFTKSHPCPNKKQEIKIHSLSEINNIQIILKNLIVKVKNKKCLYMNENSNGNNFYILYNNKIIVCSKHLKIMTNLSINNFYEIYPPFSLEYSGNLTNILKKQYMYKYLIFEILDCKFFFVAGYLDNSFRIYTKEKDKDKDIVYSIYTESKVTCIKYYKRNRFFTGHQNGKIIKWRYSINKDISKKDNLPYINVYKKDSIYAHQTYVKIIEINEKFGIIVSAEESGLIFIRKLCDYELLSYIRLNKNTKQLIDINLYKQIIVLSVFKIKRKAMFIYTYSLNGLKLGKMQEQIKLPISFIPDTDQFLLFGYMNVYLIKISLNEKLSLDSLKNDIKSYNNDQDSDEDDDENDDNKDAFKEDYKNDIPITYFFDAKNHIVFCLFSNGRLHRVNLIKNV